MDGLKPFERYSGALDSSDVGLPSRPTGHPPEPTVHRRGRSDILRHGFVHAAGKGQVLNALPAMMTSSPSADAFHQLAWLALRQTVGSTVSTEADGTQRLYNWAVPAANGFLQSPHLVMAEKMLQDMRHSHMSRPVLVLGQGISTCAHKAGPASHLCSASDVPRSAQKAAAILPSHEHQQVQATSTRAPKNMQTKPSNLRRGQGARQSESRRLQSTRVPGQTSTEFTSLSGRSTELQHHYDLTGIPSVNGSNAEEFSSIISEGPATSSGAIGIHHAGATEAQPSQPAAPAQAALQFLPEQPSRKPLSLLQDGPWLAKELRLGLLAHEADPGPMVLVDLAQLWAPIAALTPACRGDARRQYFGLIRGSRGSDGKLHCGSTALYPKAFQWDFPDLSAEGGGFQQALDALVSDMARQLTSFLSTEFLPWATKDQATLDAPAVAWLVCNDGDGYALSEAAVDFGTAQASGEQDAGSETWRRTVVVLDRAKSSMQCPALEVFSLCGPEPKRLVFDICTIASEAN